MMGTCSAFVQAQPLARGHCCMDKALVQAIHTSMTMMACKVCTRRDSPHHTASLTSRMLLALRLSTWCSLGLSLM